MPRTSSHGRKYVCWREGPLGELPRVRLIRRVNIVRTEDAKRVLGYLEDKGAEVHTRAAELTKEDAMQLQG